MAVDVPAMIALTIAVAMRQLIGLNRHDVKIAVAHPALGRDLVGKQANRRRRAAHDDRLHAIVVIEMDVQGR